MNQLANIPVIQSIIDSVVGTFTAMPSETNLFNAVNGMYLTGEKTLQITGVKNMKIK